MKKPLGVKKLKPQHQIVIEELAKGKSQTDAYLKAYPKVKRSTARVEASKLLTKPVMVEALRLRESDLLNSYYNNSLTMPSFTDIDKPLQCVYVMSVAEKYYKIGISCDVANRLSAIQTANPFKVALVATYSYPNAILMEKSLHQKYAHKRLYGEWFELDESDLKEIEVYAKEAIRKTTKTIG